MGRGCMAAHELTRSERNRLWGKVLKSMQTKPYNWHFSENSHLENAKTSTSVTVDDRSGCLTLSVGRYTRIDHDYVFLPWTAKGRIWRMIHRLRHQILAQTVLEAERAFDREKELPLELTQALEVPAKSKQPVTVP